MSILMVCSCGQEMVTEDEHAGRKVRCPVCKSIVVVPGVRRGPVVARRDVGPREDDDDDQGSRHEEGGLGNRDRLARARLGLGFHWGKALCFLILSAFALLGSLIVLIMTISAAARSTGGTDSIAAMGIVVGLMTCLGTMLVFVMPILSAVGSLMCFWLPRRSGGQLLAKVAFGLDAAAFFFLIVITIVYLSLVRSLVGQRSGTTLENILFTGGFITVLFILVLLLMLAGWILHMLMLKNLAQYTRYHRTASDVARMLIVGVAALAAPAILIFLLQLLLLPRAGRAGVFLVEFLMIAWTGSLLAVSFKLLNLTSSVRRLL